MRDFLRALRRPSADERLAWWREHLPSTRRTEAGLLEAYATAVTFLRNFGAEAYRTRGHSSDTSLAPNFTVWHALGVVRALDRTAKLNRVLIIGPGLDWAPRTGLRDGLPPRSYQPFLLARSLFQHSLSTPERLEITCIDINPRVLAFLKRSRRIRLPEETGNAEYTEWLQSIGPEIEMPEPVFRRLRGELADITTTPLHQQFDLVVATNVLVYFSADELRRAVANVATMLHPGGYFVHNEPRPEVDVPGLPPLQGRTIEIAKGAKAPLRDVAVIHRRE